MGSVKSKSNYVFEGYCKHILRMSKKKGIDRDLKYEKNLSLLSNCLHFFIYKLFKNFKTFSWTSTDMETKDVNNSRRSFVKY